MPKTPNLNLELTSDTETLFRDWWKAINGEGTGESKSNMQIIDEAFGNIQTSVNVTARAGEHIGNVGTPTVTVSQETDPQTGESVNVLTFNYLKGATGETGQNGQDGQDGLTTKVEVNGVEYTQVDGKITLPNYPQGGTTVVANPVLEGTESNLTAIQIGTDKFKVPTGGGSSSSPYLISPVQLLDTLQGKVFNYSKTIQFMENLGLDFSYPISEDMHQIAQTIFRIGLISTPNPYSSDSYRYTFLSSLVLLEFSTSDPSNYYTLRLYVNNDSPQDKYEETPMDVSPSSLEFSGFESIAPFSLGTYEDDSVAGYYMPIIMPLVSCVQYDQENESYVWVIKQFEWEDFFACFDTPNE